MSERFHVKQRAVLLLTCLVLAMLFGNSNTAQAQQLEPRAYSPAPVDLNIFGLAALHSSGGEVTDPASPIQNVVARVSTVMPYYGRTFALLGRQASVTVATPVANAELHGDVNTVGRSIDRTGVLDPQVRFAVNLLGGPALSLQEFRQRKPETTLGASILVNAPFGQYDSVKLINLGTNRWACKPELGFSQPVGEWSFEVYAGVWLFEANDNFYGGKIRRQDPLAAYQAHIVYEVKPHLWASVDYTYYAGGETTVNGVRQNDRQDNSRGGLTLSVPVSQAQSFKLTFARGVTVRIGTKTDTIGAAWQVTWF
jgi:hypothetical protein